MNLGRLNRVINDFSQAIVDLEQARDIMLRLADKDQLLQILNELGCVFRQRGHLDDWGHAANLLNQSLALSKELNNRLRTTDNLEDLSALYCRWATKDPGGSADKLKQAYNYAIQAQQLAKDNKYTYLEAKVERTLGDIDYFGQLYDSAFEHYFASCVLTAREVQGQWRGGIQLQRRYEQMVDRTQEQLQNLPSLSDTRKYARLLRASIADHSDIDLSLLRGFLDSAIKLASQTNTLPELPLAKGEE